MSTTALTSTQPGDPDHRTPDIHSLSVLAWELRRFRASRLFWLQALGFFCLSLFVTWAGARRHGSSELARRSHSVSVANTSPWGMLETPSNERVLLLGLLLPFVTRGRGGAGPDPSYPRAADDDRAAELGLRLGPLPDPVC